MNKKEFTLSNTAKAVATKSQFDWARRYLIYIFRWQLSTPIMAPITRILGATLLGAFSANLVGGLIFFWIDKFIFGADHKNLGKKYLMYLGRWQLTSLTLYPTMLIFGSDFSGIIWANFFGALLFFWVDKYIFKDKIFSTYWEILEKNVCVDCGHIGRGYRVVTAPGYDKRKDKNPEFRCESCSQKKLEELRKKGVKI